MPAVPPHFVDGYLEVYHTVHDCPEGSSIEERFLREVSATGELSASTASSLGGAWRWR